MDWMNVLEGAASLGIGSGPSILDAWRESCQKSAARAKKDNISDEEALRRINVEMGLGVNVTTTLLVVAFTTTLLAATVVSSNKWASLVMLSFPLTWFAPKVMYELFRHKPGVAQHAA